jgi:hypothetical protein
MWEDIPERWKTGLRKYSGGQVAPGKEFQLLAIGVGESGPRSSDEGTVLKS